MAHDTSQHSTREVPQRPSQKRQRKTRRAQHAAEVPVGGRPVVPDESPVVAAEVLLDGLGRLLHFLFEEEADYLCGAPRHVRSQKRVNYRIGYYARKFRTHLGVIFIRIPHLLYFCHRVPIVKRARRLCPDVLESLANIHAAGVTPDDAASLIKALWTVELPDEFLAELTGKLVPILEAWRAGESAGAR